MLTISQLKLPFSTKKKNVLFDLPIAQRLTLGFLLTALIAGLLAGSTALARIQSLHQQSDFYQQLLKTNTTLAEGNDFLIMINFQMYDVLAQAHDPISSIETLQDDETQLQTLIKSYDTLLNHYVTSGLLQNHPDQISLLSMARQDTQVTNQAGLARSALRTWAVFKQVQLQILKDIIPGDNDQQKIADSIYLEHLQGEPFFSDAQSAMLSLIHFNDKMSRSASDAVAVEESNQLLTTTIGIILAIISIALIGLFISNTVVYRIKQIRQITKAVEQGEVKDRIHVMGSDEIADISASVNAMLEMITSKQEVIILSELKDQFIASIGQGLHGPLTKVFHWLEFLINYHQELDDDTQMRFLGRVMYCCQEIMQIVYGILREEGTSFDDVIALLERKVNANQIKQWLQNRVKLDGVATLLSQGIESPIVTQLINNRADLRDIATNVQHLLNEDTRIDLINIWLKNGTHLNSAIAIMRLGVNLNLIGTSSKTGDFTGLTGATLNEIVSRIPIDAKILAWKPDLGTVDKGMKFGWTDTEKQKWEVRTHEQDSRAPAGSHAASGWVLRLRRGKEYMDASGTFYKQHILYNSKSPYYNPKAANDTHILIQTP